MIGSREGTGGRITRALPFTGTTATRELIEQWGRPVDEPAAGCQMLRFDMSPRGRGLVLARLSGRELQGGETAMGQVHASLAVCETLQLQPRAIIVTINNSGGRAFEERPDLQLVARAIEEGWCRFVCWRDPIRLARELMPAERFYDLLRSTDTKLVFASFGREVDWRRDRLVIRTLNMLGAEEREWIVERTSAALHSRYIEQGRGWPGTKRLGFRRNWATKELEVDPLQWEFVKRIHYGFAETDGGVSGIRTIAERVTKLGCTVTVEKTRAILRDPIYVTGAYSVNVKGVATPQRPIPIADPIPAALFAANQQLLDTRRGKQTTTHVGEFLLNAVGFAHRPCREMRDARGLRPLLRGRRQGDRDAMRYRHSPWVPSECHGLALDRDAVDPEVVNHLLTLASDPSLQAAWLASTPIPALASTTILDEEGKQILRRRIRQRERQKAQLTRNFLDRAAADDAITVAAYWELVAAISEEISELHERLATADSQPAVAAPNTGRELARAMREVLGAERGPMLVRRAALVTALVDEVLVEEQTPEEVEIEIVPAVGFWKELARA